MTNPLTVHIVDDDEAVRSSIQYLLRSLGICGNTFASGEEFLTSQGELDPGIVIIDWQMSGCGGAEVLSNLGRGFLPLVHSASLDPQTTNKAHYLGALATIEKPCSPEKLIEAIKALAAKGWRC